MSHYFGFAKVKVLAPQDLYHPVLPVRSCGKLKFALCRTCAITEQKQTCKCSDKERMFIGSWGTCEIMLAIEKGYKIIKIYEVLHFEETCIYDPKDKKGGLFSQYIDTFLKIKQEASGWPEYIDETKEDEKDKYIKNYYENEGIQLDKENICYNAGRRTISKGILCNLWGKYGERPHLNDTAFFHDTACEAFFSLFLDKTKIVKNFKIVSDTMIMVDYETKQPFVRDNKQTNIFIAAFTTMHARIELYKLLDILGERVMYYDTDSVIYLTKQGQESLKKGDYLGDLTSEISLSDGGYITEFVSCGPKNYAYITPTGKQVCKIRGFSLNFANNKILNMRAMRDMVINDSSKKHTIYNPHKICRSKGSSVIYNRPEEKAYQMIYTKRVITADYDTIPYGLKIT